MKIFLSFVFIFRRAILDKVFVFISQCHMHVTSHLCGYLLLQIAKRQGVVNPENTFFSVKRFIGRKMDEVREESKQVPYVVSYKFAVTSQLHPPFSYLTETPSWDYLSVSIDLNMSCYCLLFIFRRP